MRALGREKVKEKFEFLEVISVQEGYEAGWNNEEMMREEKGLESAGDRSCLDGLCRLAINSHNPDDGSGIMA